MINKDLQQHVEMKKQYAIFDNVTQEYLISLGSSLGVWSACYLNGTKDIKIGSDIPVLFSNRDEAKQAVEKITRTFLEIAENAEIDFSIKSGSIQEAFVLD